MCRNVYINLKSKILGCIRFGRTYRRRWLMILPKGFSQQYILMTLIPMMISFISWTLLSVQLAITPLQDWHCLRGNKNIWGKIDLICSHKELFWETEKLLWTQVWRKPYLSFPNLFPRKSCNGIQRQPKRTTTDDSPISI